MRCLLLMSVFLFESGVTMDFMDIVRTNSCAPDAIVTKMRELCEEGGSLADIASAFLDNFGEEDFKPRSKPECKNYSQELRSQLRDAALLIGKDMRKLGESGFDEDSLRNLIIAKRFLEFADGNSSHSFFDEDISKSFAVNELRSMIDMRRRYLDSIEQLKDDVKLKREEKQEDRSGSSMSSACLSDDES